MKPNELFEYDESGISYEDLKDAIRRRMEYNYPDVVAKTDPRLLDDALGDVASFHQGAEEIGSSDMFIMMRSVMQYIDSEKNRYKDFPLKDSVHDDDPEDESRSTQHGFTLNDPHSIDRSNGEETNKKPGYMRQAIEYLKTLGEEGQEETQKADPYKGWKPEMDDHYGGFYAYDEPKKPGLTKRAVNYVKDKLGEETKSGIVKKVAAQQDIPVQDVKMKRVSSTDMKGLPTVKEDFYSDRWAKEKAAANRERMAKEKKQKEWSARMQALMNPKPPSAKATVERLVRMGEPMVADWFHGGGGYEAVRDGIIDLANDHGIKWDSRIINAVMRKWNLKPGDMPEEMTEGYILKKTNVDKHISPGEPDEYIPDVTVKDTDYEIINNKTGQVVGVANWTTNDYVGPSALKITMKNGATRWLDIWDKEKGNPQTAFNRFVKDPKTAKKYKRMTGIKDSDRARVAAELKAKKEADKLAARTQREADKAAKKAKLQKDINRLSMMLGSYVGEVFPDADPYELIANDYREYHRAGTLNKLLDLAARKNGSKNYNDFLADFYDEQAADNPEQWGHVGGKDNPFRESVDEGKPAPWDEPITYSPPKEIVAKIDQLGFVHDSDNQDLNSAAKMAWKARDFDRMKYKELYQYLKSTGFSNKEGKAYRTRGGQHVNLEDVLGVYAQLGYDRGMTYVSIRQNTSLVESKGARILAIQKRADALWKKYSSPRNINRMNPEDMIGLIDLIAGGRTYMFTNEIERVPGARTMMAAVNDMANPSQARFMKGLSIMIKHLDKGYGPGLREDTDWKPKTWDEARAEAIAQLEKSIRRMQNDQGWSGLGTGLGGGTYNRDWKKDISRAKKRLARMKRGEGEDAGGRDLYETQEVPQTKSAILAGLKDLVKD